jgi:hypothetical protein
MREDTRAERQMSVNNPKMLEQRFKPGWKGGPGRPAGSRDRLQRQFLYALAEDFEKHGEGAIRICRVEDPVRYLTIVASLMPRELSLEHSVASDLDDDVLSQMIEHLRQQLLAQSGVEPTKLIVDQTANINGNYAISDKPLTEQEWVEKHVKH